jgi:hypothetical protein
MVINEVIVLHNRNNEANFILMERRAYFGYLLVPCRIKSEAPPTRSPELTMVYIQHSRCEAVTAVLLKIDVV